MGSPTQSLQTWFLKKLFGIILFVICFSIAPKPTFYAWILWLLFGKTVIRAFSASPVRAAAASPPDPSRAWSQTATKKDSRVRETAHQGRVVDVESEVLR